MVFWPTMEILVWGYVTLYIQSVAHSVSKIILFLVGAMILWDVLYRMQQGVAVSFLEDVWAKNLLNIFCAPITFGEYIFATFLFGLIRVCIALGFMTALAWFLFKFNIFKLGLYLIPFIFNLLFFGVILGVITISIVLRFGQSAELLAWAIPVFIQPASAVFYPIGVLPAPLKFLSLCLPSTYVFEGMRAVLSESGFNCRYLVYAILFNLVYMGVAVFCVNRAFNYAKQTGSLSKLGLE